LQTEFPFTLPKGYVDDDGTLHKTGIMRLACARDEIEPLRDGRVKENEAYATVIVLARVVTQLGTVTGSPPGRSSRCSSPTSATCRTCTGSSTSRTRASSTRWSPEPLSRRRRWRWVRALRHDELWQEIAFLAYHLHWDFDRLLDLEHGDRIRLLREVGGLNERAWQGVTGG
jgi:hypothetical protein